MKTRKQQMDEAAKRFDRGTFSTVVGRDRIKHFKKGWLAADEENIKLKSLLRSAYGFVKNNDNVGIITKEIEVFLNLGPAFTEKPKE